MAPCPDRLRGLAADLDAIGQGRTAAVAREIAAEIERERQDAGVRGPVRSLAA